MKNDQNEEAEAYKIRNDALEIMNEAYRVKIEALELLNANLQFLREAKSAVNSNGTHSNGTHVKTATTVSGQSVSAAHVTGEKRGRGRPRKSDGPVASATETAVSEPVETGEKRGRGRPKKSEVVTKVAPKGHNGKKRGRKPKGFYDTAAPVAATAEAAPSGEKRGRGRPKKADNAPAANGDKVPFPHVEATDTKAAPAKRGRKAKNASITRLQVPLDASLRDMLHEEGFNKATFRALTGILLCLFENGTATVSNLHEYIGGSRVTVVRHTALLKKIKLISYEGSRKKGYYALTAQGKHLHDRLVNA